MIKTIDSQGWLENELDWTPLTKTSANFTTHRLHLSGFHEMQSRMTLSYILFLLLFFGIGTVLLWFITFGDPVYRRGAAPFSGKDIFADILSYFICIAFTLVGSLGFILDKKVTINRLNNSLSTGEKNLNQESVNWVLNEVIAIQILSKHCRNDDYIAFELNAVFKNKQRINILSHGGQTAIIKDGKRVANFLAKPLFSNV